MHWSESISLQGAINRGLTGKGITVAILDTGIYPHVDFEENRIIAFCDVVKNRKRMYDDNGHGTHIAGLVGSCGRCQGYPVGVASGCNIVAVKVLDSNGDGRISHLLRGINWVLKKKEEYNIRIVNISIGTVCKTAQCEESALVNGVNALWNAGIVVVTAAGNNGPKEKSVTTPGISRKVITVGSSDDHIRTPNHPIHYSGRGPTPACICKPEIVAPGCNLISCLNDRRGYVKKTGTSMATPLVSGAVALLLEKEPTLTPKDVKLKLYHSAQNIGIQKNIQGWGQLDIDHLLKVE